MDDGDAAKCASKSNVTDSAGVSAVEAALIMDNGDAAKVPIFILNVLVLNNPHQPSAPLR